MEDIKHKIDVTEKKGESVWPNWRSAVGRVWFSSWVKIFGVVQQWTAWNKCSLSLCVNWAKCVQASLWQSINALWCPPSLSPECKFTNHPVLVLFLQHSNNKTNTLARHQQQAHQMIPDGLMLCCRCHLGLKSGSRRSLNDYVVQVHKGYIDSLLQVWSFCGIYLSAMRVNLNYFIIIHG